MKSLAVDLWKRAGDAIRVAKHDLLISPDAAASRAYYAAFHAVSALFALEEKTFQKHSAVEAAVHRDLVKTGRWPEELGEGYSRLVESRSLGDYGGGEHVSPEEATEAIQIAARILEKVSRYDTEIFSPAP